MSCHLKGHDARELVVLPRCAKLASEQALACVACAREYGLWCDQHQLAHTGFVDGTTACLGCVQDLMWKTVGEATNFLRQIQSLFTAGEYAPLGEWFALVTGVTGQSREVCLARAVASFALRQGCTTSSVFDKMFETRDVSPILPSYALMA